MAGKEVEEECSTWPCTSIFLTTDVLYRHNVTCDRMLYHSIQADGGK